jgi:hypothetical protein
MRLDAPRSRYTKDEPLLGVGQKRECAVDVSYKGAQRAASTIIGAVCGAAEEGFCARRSPQRRCEGAPPGEANELPWHSKEVMP